MRTILRTRKVLKLAVFIAVAIIFNACKNENVKPVTSTTSNNYKIVILSDNGSINNGKGKFYIEFQDVANNKPVDVGNVKVRATMPMPGMPMVNDAEVTTPDNTGRYAVKYDLSMAGSWTLKVQFNNNQSAVIPITVN